MSRILYQLARHPEVQDQLRSEIKAAVDKKRNVSADGRLEYDEISALPVLDAVIKESLRL